MSNYNNPTMVILENEKVGAVTITLLLFEGVGYEVHRSPNGRLVNERTILHSSRNGNEMKYWYDYEVRAEHIRLAERVLGLQDPEKKQASP